MFVFFALVTKAQMISYVTRVLYCAFLVISRTNLAQKYPVVTDNI